MANNGVIGDEDLGMNIPTTDIDEKDLSEERSIAKFTRTKEYKRLEEHMNERIKFYQQYLPGGGELLSNETDAVRGQKWAIADAVIGEFRAVMNAYEQTAQTVKDADAAGPKS